MPNTTTSGEDAASALTGNELVRIVQGGLDARTTTGEIASLGSYESPLTTTGDILVRGADGDTRQPIGTDKQTLCPDSTSATGMSWTGFDSPATGPAGTLEGALSGPIWLNGKTGADPTGATDSITAINTALATGRDVYGIGNFASSAVATMSSTQGQRFIILGGALKPTFKGDTIRVMAFHQEAHVAIDGSNQTGSGTAGAAFVVGYGGANAQQSSLARSRVINYTGDAVRWENGSMVDFTGMHGQAISGDGFLCTGTYNDNNHGHFADTHMIACAGIGYNIKGADSGVFYDANASRSHQFVNAKAFGCGQNFFINSTGNVGTVFTELGTNPDAFGPLSAGNNIGVIETETSFAAWIDNSTQGQNSLSGIDSFYKWSHRFLNAAKLSIQALLQGALDIQQTAHNTFTASVSATNDPVTLTFDKGTASEFTIRIADHLQLPGPSGMVISYTATGTVSPTIGTLAAGASTNFTIATAATGAQPGDNAWCTVSFAVAAVPLSCTTVINNNGDLLVSVTNVSGGVETIAAGAISVRWNVWKHYP